MPGILLCEAVFQAGSFLLAERLAKAHSDSRRYTPILSRIREAKFKNMVQPGDEIRIEAVFKKILMGLTPSQGRSRAMTESLSSTSNSLWH